MNSDETQKIVSAIRQLALMQSDLIDNANATPEHTKFILGEIVERCNQIKPSRVVYDPAKLIDDELTKFLSGVVGVVEATRDETHAIWERYVEHRDPPMTWKQYHGYGLIIGEIDGRPVFVSLTINEVAGHRILFYEVTSTVADHDMVRAFLEAVVPETAKQGDRLNHSDSTNFCNVLPREKAAA